MKIKRVISLFIGFIFSLMTLALTGCKSEIDMPENENAGAITGRAYYSNASDNSTIQITLDKTDRLRTAAVLSEAGLYDPECYEVGSSNGSNSRSVVSYTLCSKTGEYTFKNLQPGVYTVYAPSPNSREKGICRSVVVEDNKTVQADDILLTATGSITGKINP